MNITEKIRQQIENIPEDTVFGYNQLGIAKAEYQTAAKVLERLLKKEVIKKISNGIFYKPKMTVFGELKPNSQEILQPYLFNNGKRIAYVTGISLYNKLGLTTQIAFKINIASRSKRITINTGSIKAVPSKSYVEVTDENYELLGFLDALKDLKIIPDSTIITSFKIIRNNIEQLNDKQTLELIEYALHYPPRVRALLGAMLEQLKQTNEIEKLMESLNPLTKYKLGIKIEYLPTALNWNIV